MADRQDLIAASSETEGCINEASNEAARTDDAEAKAIAFAMLAVARAIQEAAIRDELSRRECKPYDPRPGH